MSRIQAPQNEYAEQVTSLAQLGSQAIVDYIYSLPLEERIDAVRSTQKALFAAAQDGAGLDLYASTMRELINRGTSGLGTVGQSEENDKVLDSYNAMSFNFAADLADCWPDDVLPREKRHFEEGLRAAEDCVRWRNELNKPPYPFSIAYWAKGMHLLSLGYYSGAVKSFNLALGFALRAAQDNNKLTSFGADSTFGVLLSTGYLGLAEQLEGNPQGQARYDSAITAFRQQAEKAERAGDSEVREEAEFGLSQLETVRRKYLS